LGNDTLKGSAGADRLAGGAGDDTYVVVGDDVVIELDGEGTDTVLSAVSYTLGSGVERLTLAGAEAISGTGNGLANLLTGNAAANKLSGAGGNDTLRGGLGNDMLNGGAGADRLEGGAGDDGYFVGADDVVIEIDGEGTDTVVSSLSYTLGTGVERLTLTGAEAISGTGNAAANLLLGNAAANVLDGGLGADIMKGGAGDDTYLVDASSDRVVELAASGTDSVQASASFALAANVENLTLTGTALINGTGNAASNLISGNDARNALAGLGGADTLSGGAGNDLLKGGTGNDVLTGGAGADNFFFIEAPGTANSDLITDFASGADRLALDDAFFSGLGALGRFALADARFYAAADATAGHDADDRIVYDSSTGALYYDADGSGAAVALLFATLQDHPTLGASDITVI
jgi:Ca2+-binding RTX toxin-like protein